MVSKKYLLFSLVFALVNVFVLLVFFVPRLNHTDTQQYVATINYVLGQEGGELHLNRLLFPFPIIIGALLNPFLSPQDSLIFQNLIFYFFSAILIFFFIQLFYKNAKQAFYGVVLYTSAYPMLAYGLAVLTDLSGWFFYLLSVLLSLRFINNPNRGNVLLAGFVAGIGMLFKENTAAAAIFFAALLFFAAQFSIKEKVKYIFIFGIALALPIIINSIIFYQIYSYSYLQRYIDVVHDKTGGIYAYSLLRIVIEIGRVLAVGWIFVLLGLIKESFAKNKGRLKILIALIFPSLSFFLWAFPHNRIIFIAAPLLVLLASLGILRNFKSERINITVELSLLSLYVLVNYVLLEFLLRYGPQLQYKF